jgi:glutamyl-Q tRNA(Asp) synthetase
VLGLSTPQYYHLPVVVNEQGQKLSKQTGATAIDARHREAAATVLELLGLTVPPALAGERPGVLWQWAIERWSIDGFKGRRTLCDVV